VEVIYLNPFLQNLISFWHAHLLGQMNELDGQESPTMSIESFISIKLSPIRMLAAVIAL
jgi:hypothetical protein